MKKAVAFLLAILTMLCACSAYAASDDNKDKNKRYSKIYADDSFYYYMDTKSAKWILCPNTRDEYIIDVWIKLEQVSEAVASGGDTENTGENAAESGEQYSYPARYYLEHYYMNPASEEIQFLCELEVTGRPDNDIAQRDYDMHNWEPLVPDSIEDNLYRAVVRKMGKKRGMNGSSFDLGNMMEDVFRVSI